MKIKRIKPRSKRVASALQFTSLTNEQADRLYRSFYESFKNEVRRDLRDVKLIVINGGKHD